jgi:hypothetical protein
MTSSTQANDVFTAADVERYWQVIAGSRATAKVAWLNDNDDVVRGRLRAMFPTARQDVRDLEIRVTTRSGMELNMPITELLAKPALSIRF